MAEHADGGIVADGARNWAEPAPYGCEYLIPHGLPRAADAFLESPAYRAHIAEMQMRSVDLARARGHLKS